MIFGLKSRKKPANYEAGEKIIYINPADIVPNTDQPRKYFDENSILRLADSIRRYGMIHPLTVRVPDPDEMARRDERAGNFAHPNDFPDGSLTASRTSLPLTPSAAAQPPKQAEFAPLTAQQTPKQADFLPSIAPQTPGQAIFASPTAAQAPGQAFSASPTTVQTPGQALSASSIAAQTARQPGTLPSTAAQTPEQTIFASPTTVQTPKQAVAASPTATQATEQAFFASSIAAQTTRQPSSSSLQPFSRGGRPDIGAAADSGRTVYMLISGERRYRAAVMLGLSAVPCIVKNYDDSQSATVSIVENLLRRDLNMFEQAKAFEKLIAEYGLTQLEVAERLSTSQSCVANKLRLMKLSDSEQHFIIENGLTERHARALLRITDIPLRKAAMMAIADKKLNVSSAESYIERLVDSLNVPKTGNSACTGAEFQSAVKNGDSGSPATATDCCGVPNDILPHSEADMPAESDGSAINEVGGNETGSPDANAPDISNEIEDKSRTGAVKQPILPADNYKKKLSGAFGRIFRQMPVETAVTAENDDEIVFTVTVRKSRMA